MLSGIFVMGIIQGLVLSAILMRIQKGERLANTILAVLILLTTLTIFGQFLSYSSNHLVLPTLFLLMTGLPFALGPFLFFYTKRRLSHSFKVIQLSSYLHLIPLLCYYGMLTYLIIVESEGNIQLFVHHVTRPHDVTNYSFVGIVKAIHLLIYSGISWYVITKNKSSPQPFGLSLLLLTYLLLQITLWILILLRLPGIDNIFSVMQVGYIFMIGYAGLVKPDTIFHLINQIKYKSARLSINESKILFLELENHLNTNRPYLNPSLSLTSLAEEMNWTTHQLSQVINEHSQTNFSDYINRYRVDKVVELMNSSKHRHLTLLALGHEAGFNSKNAFNVAFKKIKGITPSQYRKSHS